MNKQPDPELLEFARRVCPLPDGYEILEVFYKQVEGSCYPECDPRSLFTLIRTPAGLRYTCTSPGREREEAFWDDYTKQVTDYVGGSSKPTS